MNDRANPEALFLQHLGWIDRVVSITCSKHGVLGADAEDFGAWVRLKLMDDDYAVLRQFQGYVDLKTYLASVVVRHFLDFQRERLGRWRSSAAAERLGPPAMELEALVYRDGYTLYQAGEKLRTAGRTTLSDSELARLLAQLPARTPSRPVEVGLDASMEAAPDTPQADERVIEAEADTRPHELMNALAVAMKQLDPEDQLIVRMHFADGYTLADVARALGLEEKPLYSRVEHLRARLRAHLVDAGARRDDVDGLL